MRKNFLIIHNEMAGRRNTPLLVRVRKEMETRGLDLTFKAASSLQEDIELAGQAVRSGEVDAVVAAGGDSTIRGVATGLLGQDMPLGIIPAGTGNVLAHEIGLGLDPVKITDALMTGTLKTIRPGLANGEPFLLMAGVGFDAQIVKNLDHDLKQKIKKAAYIWPTLKALAGKPPHLNVEFDGEEHDELSWDGASASFVIVTKARLYGGSFIIAPDADLASDSFQVVMFMDRSRLGLVRALLGIALGGNQKIKKEMTHKGGSIGQIMKSHGVMIRSCKNVRITSCDPVLTEIDGEWLGQTPLELRSDDRAVRLIVPS